MNAKVMKEMLEQKSGSFEHIAVCDKLSAFITLPFNPQYALVTGVNTQQYMFQTFLIKLGETQTFSYVIVSTSGSPISSQGRATIVMDTSSTTGKVYLGFQVSPPSGLQDAMRVIAFG